ncbi:MAG: hypoxanthine-guanine phosphoribosyltransferase [Verrucomicrobiales bacterium]|nr:hypoxanthine-guanine phosphoribosyltransferase [Verrucomicrobiales bacterium]
MHNDIDHVLLDEGTILRRLDGMARDITRDYEGRMPTIVCILHGGIILMADLLRRVELPLLIETISVSSYHGGVESSGVITFHQKGLPDLKGKHVILLDDILDTGRTLAAISRRFTEEAGAASVKLCVLLRKVKDRACAVEADYVGFDIGDEFVVGYGLDYQGQYRNLPYIGVLKPEAISRLA